MEIPKDYLEKLKARSSKDNARTYIESIALPYLPNFNWTNDTLERDLKAFYIAIYRYNAGHTIYQFQKLLDWAKGKNLHPRQFIKLLYKK